ncbi:hypothetical protein CBL_05523 [Carabus blaptoides fortunei]
MRAVFQPTFIYEFQVNIGVLPHTIRDTGHSHLHNHVLTGPAPGQIHSNILASSTDHNLRTSNKLQSWKRLSPPRQIIPSREQTLRATPARVRQAKDRLQGRRDVTERVRSCE